MQLTVATLKSIKNFCRQIPEKLHPFEVTSYYNKIPD